jgi:hypothetical protein
MDTVIVTVQDTAVVTVVVTVVDTEVVTVVVTAADSVTFQSQLLAVLAAAVVLGEVWVLYVSNCCTLIVEIVSDIIVDSRVKYFCKYCMFKAYSVHYFFFNLLEHI